MTTQDLKQIKGLLQEQEERLEKRFEKKFVTKDDLQPFATKDDLTQMENRFSSKFATKEDLNSMKKEIIDAIGDTGQEIMKAAEESTLFVHMPDFQNLKNRVKKLENVAAA